MIKKNKSRAVRIIFIGIGLAVLACLLAIGNQFLDVPLRVSKETTYVTEPLLPDGQVDFVAAFENATLSDRVATENNGYRLIVEKLGNPGYPAKAYAALRSRLGLPEVKTKTIHYQTCDKFLGNLFENSQVTEELVEKLAERKGILDYKESFNLDRNAAPTSMDLIRVVGQTVLDGPWVSDDFPPLRTWLSENESALDVIAEAVRKPEFDLPLANVDADGFEEALGEMFFFRSLSQDLATRANYHLGMGEIDEAIDDCLTIKRLGRCLRSSSRTRLILMGIASEATPPGIGSNLDHQPSADQLDRYITALQQLPAPSTIDNIAFYWRLKTLAKLSKESWGESDEYSSSIDFNVTAARWNQLIDERFQSATPIVTRNPFQIPALSNQLEFKDQFLRRSRSLKLANLLTIDFHFPQIMETLSRAQCQSNMELISLAMLRYEKDHQTLPPAFLADDNGQPLHSWRTLLLPYLGLQELYDQIRLDEPWDSQHNRQFWKLRPAVFHCPSHEEQSPELTSYSVVKGTQSAFQGSTGKKLADFGEYSSNLILVIERKETCNWMDPTQDSTLQQAEVGINRDFAIDTTGNAVPTSHGPGSYHNDLAVFGLRSGTTENLPSALDPQQLEAMLRGEKWDPE